MPQDNKRILIFGEAILPPAYMPRIRYFMSYLKQNGWEVDFIVENSIYENQFPTDVNVYAVDYYKFKNKVLSKIEWLINFFVNLFFDYKGNFFYYKSKSITKDKKYDIVFCSSCFTFPLTTAAKVAKKNGIPLVVDLRDIAEQSPNDHHYMSHKPPYLFGEFIINLFKNINLKRRNNALNYANAVTTVSPWHVQTLKQYNPNVNLIYNGFDEKVFVPQLVPVNEFVISYFGRVYNQEMRNPRLLFGAIENLSKQGIISPKHVTLKWYVDESSQQVIQNILADYQIDEYIKFYSFVNQQVLVDEMNKSSILLTLSNDTSVKKYFGIMTTKLFESIGVNRPILCIPKNDDDLSLLIEKENLGLTSSSITEIENFIVEHFQTWQQNAYTVGAIPESKRLNFSRQKGGQILEKILIDCINKKQKK